VTQDNRGKRTSGVDGILITKDKERIRVNTKISI
jgi:hypothetical protein